MKTRHIPNLQALQQIDDYESFMRRNPRVRRMITDRIEWILKIEAAAHGEKEKIKKAAAKDLGVSLPTVNRFAREYRTGGWRKLCDGRGKHGPAKPEAFQAFVRSLHLQCQRTTTGREVCRMLIERWKAWKRTGDAKFAIPGYDVPPPAGPCGYPAGWSEDSIRRMRPDNYALSVARQGAKSAAGFLPSILKTRVGVAYGSVVFMDDQDMDVKIAPRGVQQRAIRPQGFAALEYLSGCFVDHVSRLRWWDANAEKFRTLTSQDFVWFVIGYLQKHGYRRDSHGTTLVMEHGTACGYSNKNLSTAGGFSNFDDALAAVSHGCIRVERSGLFNQPAFAGMLFRPQSSGNPNFKAPIESMFNLVRGRMAALPGATGRNRDLKPAESYGQDHYTGQMLKLYARLDERHRELIRFPLLTAEEYGDIERAVFNAINSRTDHGLEGWEKLGFVAPQFRFTPDERSPWLSREEVVRLPEGARLALLANSETPGHVRTWKLSPADVAQQCAKELTKLPDCMIPLLVPMQWARPATVKSDRTISISDQLLGSEPFTYVCRIEGPDGAHVLKPGLKVLAYLNPFNPERLVICQEDGSYLGTLNQMTRAGFMDQAAILDQLKERSEMKADMDTAVRPHLEGVMRNRADMKRVNEKLAIGKPVLPEEVAEARAESAREGVRTRKTNEIAAAMGADALSPSNLLDQDDADDMQESCTPPAQPFSASQFLNPTADETDD
ncbi:MAG: hypothetical protein ABJQ29_11370 [Luteolibacter sp.]